MQNPDHFRFVIAREVKGEWLFEQFKRKLDENSDTPEDTEEFVDNLKSILSEKSGFDSGL